MCFPLYSVDTDCQAYCMQNRVHALVSAVQQISSAWTERQGRREGKEEGRPSREEQARGEMGEQGRG